MRRANRLRTLEEFSLVYRAGARARTGSIVAVGIRSDQGEPRVGITCSRSVGNAVLRNRAKRRIRAAVDPLIVEMAPGAQVVVQATKHTIPQSFQKLVDDVREGLHRVGAIDA